jgi:anthranilate phosphoribosyltransferase
MSIATYLKEIGRGKEGARSLSKEQAYDLMSQVLDGRVTDVELGAFCVAMRIKGESADELAGFVQAARERCLPPNPPSPMVVLPSYNGARKLPNLTPLLALMLARSGVAVLVHGAPDDPTRTTTAEIFQALGLSPAQSPADIMRCWAQREPAYLPIEYLCPPLARLLDVRWKIGLRNSGHTVAKLLDPGDGLRIAHYTHPAYGTLMREFLQTSGANAVLLRGTEGEPFADPRRTPAMEVFLQGIAHPSLGVAAQKGVLTELPPLPTSCGARETARYILAVTSGMQPVPLPVRQQVECILRALAWLHEGRTATHGNTS